MKYEDPRTVVSTEWLGRHLRDPDMRVLDASWYLPDADRDPKAEFDAAHIPGARFFDIDEIADTQCGLPHMAPPSEKFAARVRSMGIGDGHQVVVYDGAGLFSAARVWWLFRLMGFRDVAVLDGGFPKWRMEGRPVEDMPAIAKIRHITVRRQEHLVKTADQVRAAARDDATQVVDARPPSRFRGDEPEPRPGLRLGHIPGSLNVHYAALLNDDGTLRSKPELESAFSGAGVSLGRPVITTCGSGVTAAILDLALELLGHGRHAVYDGSWAEWGADPNSEIETG
ncbi:MAG: 3-mercaptopyruvate sulfurtransferase [Albidovulum sp.]|nr:3-mercaptopyruvate sulfurtransferase [Albidovulum sp.]MDE0304675.1 3-mercaptopyruvate sulfurtransferase [Albidovulum sp.]MDE0530420.1 3-mercaptopyruvate sulfurtransferase [Albidovulum sp.]